MKILIADDNRQIRWIIRRLVERYTTHIIECREGGEAVRAYENEHPDCVLMDIEMSPMDGFEAAAKIRETHPEAKVIFVTHHDGALLRKAAENCGAKGYVLKENLTELTTVIETMFPNATKLNL